MKVCNSEAMKIIKQLEEKKKLIIYTEKNRSRVSYRENEPKCIGKYNYVKTRKEIAELDEQIRKIKQAISKSNCSVLIGDFNITIGEALVYIAQLNAEYERLDDLSSYDKLSRRITNNGVLEYTECLYEPEEVEKEQKVLYSEICKLQVAIDRANLNSFIEI